MIIMPTKSSLTSLSTPRIQNKNKCSLIHIISFRYNLFAVLVHRGEVINHGHYYCFVKPFAKSDQWYKFDDKSVSKATKV